MRIESIPTKCNYFLKIVCRNCYRNTREKKNKQKKNPECRRLVVYKNCASGHKCNGCCPQWMEHLRRPSLHPARCSTVVLQDQYNCRWWRGSQCARWSAPQIRKMWQPRRPRSTIGIVWSARRRKLSAIQHHSWACAGCSATKSLMLHCICANWLAAVIRCWKRPSRLPKKHTQIYIVLYVNLLRSTLWTQTNVPHMHFISFMISNLNI